MQSNRSQVKYNQLQLWFQIIHKLLSKFDIHSIDLFACLCHFVWVDVCVGGICLAYGKWNTFMEMFHIGGFFVETIKKESKIVYQQRKNTHLDDFHQCISFKDWVFMGFRYFKFYKYTFCCLLNFLHVQSKWSEHMTYWRIYIFCSQQTIIIIEMRQ